MQIRYMPELPRGGGSRWRRGGCGARGLQTAQQAEAERAAPARPRHAQRSCPGPGSAV